jgi:CheY-like chemotaxis protein
MSDVRSLNILLIEDDDVAAEAVILGLRRHAAEIEVTPAEDGAVALQILRGQHPTHRVAAPRLVLLDLNMPRMNGFEFLRELRLDRELRRTVVFVLTTSDIETDRRRAYEERVAGYIVKSRIGPQCSGLARFLTEYREVVLLPD